MKTQTKHSSEPVSVKQQENEIPKTNGDNQHFDEIETELIELILQKSKTGATVSVPEINRILGLSSKNEAIQKKNRSEKINRINEKWALLSPSTTGLIQRKRSDIDKRILEYYIEPTDFEQIRQYIQPEASA